MMELNGFLKHCPTYLENLDSSDELVLQNTSVLPE